MNNQIRFLLAFFLYLTLTVPSYATIIGDFVWEDLDADGIQDPGEPGIQGVSVTVTEVDTSWSDTVTSDLNGNYLFDSLNPQNDGEAGVDYFVTFAAPAGYFFSPRDQGSDDSLDSDADPTTGQTATTTLDFEEDDRTWDAGLYREVLISGHKFHDLNRNGQQDAGEEDLAGWMFSLFDGIDNILLAEGITDDLGNITFSGLMPGTYSLTETIQDGWELVSSPAMPFVLASGENAIAEFGNIYVGVPEPTTFALLGLGLAGISLRRKKAA